VFEIRRFEYRFYKEISNLDLKSYPLKVANAADKCDIKKFAVFAGYGYWLREMHDIIRIEFSRGHMMTNLEIKEFKDALDTAFNYGENTIFVVYEEIEK
jgi:hypothetical protein